MKIEKDTVTFEAPDADFVTKFGIQAAADMVLDFHCFHPQLPFLYDARQLAAFLLPAGKSSFTMRGTRRQRITPSPSPSVTAMCAYCPCRTTRCVAGSGRSAGISSPICLSHRRPPPIGRAALQRQRRAPCGQAVSPEAGYLRLFFGSICFEQIPLRRLSHPVLLPAGGFSADLSLLQRRCLAAGRAHLSRAFQSGHAEF